jgi:hypothetical protein
VYTRLRGCTQDLLILAIQIKREKQGQKRPKKAKKAKIGQKRPKRPKKAKKGQKGLISLRHLLELEEFELHLHEELPDGGHDADSVGGHHPADTVHSYQVCQVQDNISIFVSSAALPTLSWVYTKLNPMASL